MKVSAKGRYGLAAMISISQSYSAKEYITVSSIAEKLGISKIYLEQVFSQLKRAGLVASVKGAQGGYRLARAPKRITAFDILSATENSLLEKPEKTVARKSPEIESAMQVAVFKPLSRVMEAALRQITLYDLVAETERHRANSDFMFYI